MGIEFEESTDNVFADLGLEDAEDLQTRSIIGYYVIQALKGKKMKQRELSNLLKVKQAEVSLLLNGHSSRFTIDKLFDFLKRLDQKVSIQISRHKQGEPFQ